jgi:HEPN domain-containing protein
MYLHSDDPPVTACSQRSPAGNEKQAADHLISRLFGTDLGLTSAWAILLTKESTFKKSVVMFDSMGRPKMVGQVSSSSQSAKEALLWLKWADSDYQSARLLLLQGLLVQGAAFSNTAVEKYLKSVFAHRGLSIPHSHEVVKLYQRFKNETGSDLDLNLSYLRLLQKAYKLRYPDEATDGFNIALNGVRLLVELDRTAKKIIERFHIVRTDRDERVMLILERAMQNKDGSVLTSNAALNPSLGSQLFSNPSPSYDFRRHNGQIYETNYFTETVSDGPDYELEGFAVISDNQFRVAYLPILQNPNSASVNGLAQVRVP